LTQNPSFPLPIKTYRDVRIFQFINDEVMVVGCDSAGGIGPKPLDKVKVDGYTVGKFTTRVALMEVLSVGAKPICVVNNLCVELNPTGLEILKGVKDEAIKAGLNPEMAVTGSSEKNFAVEQTGIGITVIGFCKKESLRIGVSQPGDAVIVLGNTCMGDEVVKAESEGRICDIADVLNLLRLEYIHEVIPVGSEGIKREVNVLTRSSGLNFKQNFQCKIDFEKSAGPATALLATLPVSKIALVERAFSSKPVKFMGTLFQ
jgi:hypothetical protein